MSVPATSKAACFKMLRYAGPGFSFWRTYNETTDIDRNRLRGCADRTEFSVIPSCIGGIFRVIFENGRPTYLRVLTNEAKVVIDDRDMIAGGQVLMCDSIIKIVVNGIDLLCFRQSY